MKATIDATGTLTIQAESELESYALDRWSDSYFDKDESAQRKSILLIETTVVAPTQRQSDDQLRGA